MYRPLSKLLFALAPLLAVLGLALPAQAALWCKTDPIVRLGGTQVQILVSIPQEYTSRVSGPVEVEVNTPRSVKRELLSTDPGFGGYGESVTFGDLTLPVRGKTFPTAINVRVPVGGIAAERVPVQVEVLPENGDPVVAVGTGALTSVELPVTGQ